MSVTQDTDLEKLRLQDLLPVGAFESLGLMERAYAQADLWLAQQVVAGAVQSDGAGMRAVNFVAALIEGHALAKSGPVSEQRRLLSGALAEIKGFRLQTHIKTKYNLPTNNKTDGQHIL